MESGQAQAESSIIKLQTELSGIKTRNTELEKDNQKLNDKLAEETNSLRQSVYTLTVDLNRTEKLVEASGVNEARAKEICEEQKVLAKQVFVNIARRYRYLRMTVNRHALRT